MKSITRIIWLAAVMAVSAAAVAFAEAEQSFFSKYFVSNSPTMTKFIIVAILIFAGAYISKVMDRRKNKESQQEEQKENEE